ncbi:uncharacterized protein [Eleutherodactylus coqui]|uniref:uncharacterized protein isoform X2 n=1 Tax=Eleutherodactylus coqui TaxID=57060 RepID=UPI003461995F
MPAVLVVLILQILSSVSSVYVRRGSDITDCSMKCPHTRDVLQLDRECGAEETKLLELWCDNSWSNNHFGPRLHLNTSSGCWRLADARKDDSCLYVLWRHNSSGGLRRSTAITVLDPVLISNITSNSSRLGQDIAVSVQFSGEEAAVTWEVDGGSLPHRYQLIDDSRMLIIPSAQREDGGRRLHVRITNPVSEETWEYLLGITGPRSLTLRLSLVAAALAVVILLSAGIFLCCKRKNMAASKDGEMKKMDGHSEEDGDPPRADQSDSPDVTREHLYPQSSLQTTVGQNSYTVVKSPKKSSFLNGAHNCVLMKMREQSVPTGVFSILILSSLSLGRVYVQRGSDITVCYMKCPHNDGILKLYKECGDQPLNLITLWCHRHIMENEYKPRLHLNIRSGCWTLRDARKNDSCLYNVTFYRSQEISLNYTEVTVLGVFSILILSSLSLGRVYVRRGSDITVCYMKCPHNDGILKLYKECGDQPLNLITLWCHRHIMENEYKPRLHLNIRSGCWTLRDARKNDSCLYNVTFYRSQEISLNYTEVTVLDPVLISNISSNSSKLGQDIAVSVQFSGEEAAVTWEVDGGSLPHRYRLIDNNTMLIIPSAQREDAGRRLRVRITNPVSEETREYLLEITVPGSPHEIFVKAMVPVIAIKIILLLSLFYICVKK